MKLSAALILVLLSAGQAFANTPGEAVAAAAKCPVSSVQRYLDGHWEAHYGETCTPAQKAAGDAALKAFDLEGWLKATDQ
jgi:hypothetical protein